MLVYMLPVISGFNITIYMIGIAGVFIIGFLGTAISRKTGLPSIIWLILFGIILGPLLGILPKQTLMRLSPMVSSIVLIIVLFNAGTRLNIFKSLKALPVTLPLTTVNYILAAIAAALVMLAFHFSIALSILMGLIVGGTSAAVIPIISKDAAMDEKGKTVVTIESILTDPIGIVLTLAMISIIMLNNYSIDFVTTTLASNFSIGIVVGAIFAMLWIPAMGYLQRNKYAYSYAASLAMIFLLYPIVQYLNGSGPISVFVFGLMIANGNAIFKSLRYRHHESLTFSKESKSFNDLITFFISSFFFVYLGGLINLSAMYAFAIGIAVSAALIIARFIGTRIVIRSQFSGYDRKQISCMVSRGMGAGVLATLLMSYNLAGTSAFIDIITTIILITIIGNSVMIFAFAQKGNKH